MYSQNAALFMERFPLLGLRAALFPIEEEKKEDLSGWQTNFADVEALYLYGLSLDAYRHIKPWLQTDLKRKLIFLENREGRIGALLQNPGASELLADPQVDLHLLPKGALLKEALHSLAKAYPVRTLEILPLPSRKTSYFYTLKTQLLRKTMLAEAIRRDRLHGYQLFSHFIRNVSHLKNSFYFNALKNAFKDIPAVICGAGPSLASAFPILESLENRALVFACGSAITACSKAGVTPHFCVAVDPNEEEFSRLKQSFAFEVPFAYSTRLHPSVFAAVNGPFGYVRSQFGDVSQMWLEEELGLQEPLIGHHLSSESISVTSMAVALAEHLGCNPILFAGLDMAYTANRRYCAEVGVAETAQEHKPKTADRRLLKKDRTGRKVYSAVRWVMESSSLSHYAKLHPHVRFLNTTEGGLGFTDIPYQPLETAAQEFTESYDLRGMIHAAIANAKMPETTAQLPQKIALLKESLLKVVDHLQILSDSRPGSKALAELEMKEELAFSVLFYDAYSLFPKTSRWPALLELALQYAAVAECKKKTQ